MAESKPPVPAARLPWSRDGAENARFGVILALMLVLFLVPALIIPSLSVPEPDRSEAERIPPRLAQLVEASKPVVADIPEPKPEPLPEPETARLPEHDPLPPEPTLQPVPQPRVAAPTDQSVEQARETAARSGLFAMKDRLAALQAPEPASRPGNRTANVSGSATAAEVREDSTAQALAGSGGVETLEGPGKGKCNWQSNRFRR